MYTVPLPVHPAANVGNMAKGVYRRDHKDPPRAADPSRN